MARLHGESLGAMRSALGSRLLQPYVTLHGRAHPICWAKALGLSYLLEKCNEKLDIVFIGRGLCGTNSNGNFADKISIIFQSWGG